MAKRIILVDHHDNLRDDRVATHLADMGFDLEVLYPFKNQKLPEIDPSIAGAVIYGGAQSLTEIHRYPFLEKEAQWIRHLIDTELPLLGICLGGQLIAHTLGAKVTHHEAGLCEFGYYEIQPTPHAGEWLSQKMLVTQAHYQQFALPESAVLLATSDNFPNQAFRYGDNVFALQFHPEVTAEMFERWQNSDWAFFDRPGAQSREQQSVLMNSVDNIQGKWFRGFLDKLFIPYSHEHQPVGFSGMESVSRLSTIDAEPI